MRPPPPRQQALPHSEEAERAVLGAVLLDDDGALGILAGLIEALRPADFYLERHQLVFAAMCELARHGQPVDMRTLQAHLEREDKLNVVGGLGYLAGLDLDLPDIGRVQVYAQIVREAAARRRAVHLGGDLIRGALDQAGNGNGQFATFATKITRQLEGLLADRSGEDTLASVGAVAEDAWAYLDNESQQIEGVRTGIPKLDDIITAMEPGKLWIIAGRPGLGKTVLLVQVAFFEAGRPNKGVAIFSLEQPAYELLIRRAASELNIAYTRMREHNCSPEQYGQLNRWFASLSSRPLWIDQSGGPTFTELAARVTRAKKSHPELTLVGVDYFGLIAHVKEDFGEMARTMKATATLAKSLGVTIVMLHQLKRTKGRRPTLDDLQYCGEAEAEGVILLHREKDRETSALGLEGEAIVAKNRGGRTGEVDLFLDTKAMIWRELELVRKLPEPREWYP